MRFAKVLIAAAVALTLASCVERTDSGDGRSAWLQPVGNLPPPVFLDCADFVLLDDRCVREWYGCIRGNDERGVCVDRWESCCKLPGRGHRKTMATVRPIER